MSNLAGKASYFGTGSNSPSDLIAIRENLGLMSTRDMPLGEFRLKDLKYEISSAKKILRSINNDIQSIKDKHSKEFKSIWMTIKEIKELKDEKEPLQMQRENSPANSKVVSNQIFELQTKVNEMLTEMNAKKSSSLSQSLMDSQGYGSLSERLYRKTK
ncbi:unnamed protein product [Blepharisma stoltei]|uniref:Uncharacterized protein n=1 Tax=Blepharisma stoltei TaxID=1481888 RepID=A0AAU9K7U2_9CILI|nr:unnamed protein product [Blepharisma stoltei]